MSESLASWRQKTGIPTWSFLALFFGGPLISMFFLEIPSVVVLWGGALLFLLLSLVLIARPALFLAIVMAFYGASQFGLQETEITSFGTFQINASRIFVFGISTLLFARIVMEATFRRGLKKLPLPALVSLVLLAWLVQSLVISPDPDVGKAVFAKILACTLVFIFSFYFIRTEGDFILLFWGATFAAVAAGSTALADLAKGRGTMEALSTGAFRASGAFGGPVVTGTFGFFAVALGITVLLTRASKRSIFFGAIISVCSGVTAILATFTRTAIVGTAIFLVLLLFSPGLQNRLGSLKRRAAFVLLVAFVFFNGLQLVSPKTLNARMSDLPGLGSSQVQSQEVASGRGLLWQTILKVQLSSTPFEWGIGHGLASAPVYIERAVNLRLDSHNSSINLLLDAGIPGLFLYLFFNLSIFKEFRKEARLTGDRLFMIWFFYTIAYFFSTEFFNGYAYTIGARWYTMAFSGALLGLASHWKKKTTENP